MQSVFAHDVIDAGQTAGRFLLGEVEAANMHFSGINEDKNEWSIAGAQVTNSMSYSSPCTPKSVFSVNVYMNTVKLMKELKEAGYVGDGTVKEGQKFAVGVVSGDPTILEQYEDEYYTRVYSKPMMTEEDAYGAMFAVSAFSKSLSRSMEIITYLNTNTDLRTVLQYGKRGVHWDYTREESKDTIKLLPKSSEYKMRLTDTGNVLSLKHSSHILICRFIVTSCKCGCKITKRLPC